MAKIYRAENSGDIAIDIGLRDLGEIADFNWEEAKIIGLDTIVEARGKDQYIAGVRIVVETNET